MILWILLVAIFLAVMLGMIVLQIKPHSLKMFEKIVCSKDEKMEISFSHLSHHQQGERAIGIYCNNYGKRRSVTAKSLLLFLLLGFLLMIPVSFLIVKTVAGFLGE